MMVKKVFPFDIVVGADCIDAMRHTNNKVYLSWMEEASLAHSDALGWPIHRFFEYGKGFVASAHMIEYVRPTFEDDHLTMYTWVHSTESRMSYRRFTLIRDKKVCMIGCTRWAFVDIATGRSCQIPPEIAQVFSAISPEDPIFSHFGVDLLPNYKLTLK